MVTVDNRPCSGSCVYCRAEAPLAEASQCTCDCTVHSIVMVGTYKESPFVEGLRKTLAINRGQSDVVVAASIRAYLNAAGRGEKQ